ncbi:hypothetical protein G6F50_017569 [Rhizopus delemar]|uniref:Uncharacterized protein n=1 Tax=Rhizopus delemar TaxID=936053 RepID=A0A9P6XQ99_9FUNG|nr:hypothetical protein G6F50_017569 [Rhizopus delemar]
MLGPFPLAGGAGRGCPPRRLAAGCVPRPRPTGRPRRGRRRRARGLSGRLRRLAAGRHAHRPLPIPALRAPAQAPAGDGPTAVAQPVAA